MLNIEWNLVRQILGKMPPKIKRHKIYNKSNTLNSTRSGIKSALKNITRVNKY